MDIKNSYDNLMYFGFRANLKVSNYLTGFNIHQKNKLLREDLLETNALENNTLSLFSNYLWEGFRLTVRYTPLVLEGLILQQYIMNNSVSEELVTIDYVTRLSEAGGIAIYKSNQFLGRVSTKIDKISKDFSELADNLEKITNNLDNLYTPPIFESILNRMPKDPKFKALLNNKLLENPYSILGIEQSADETEIKQAFRTMVVKYHPDKNDGGTDDSNKRFVLTIKAYQQLNGEHHKL